MMILSMANTSTWKEYYLKSQHRSANKLLVKALREVEKKKHALDIGCGIGIDTLYMHQQGMKVYCFDANDYAIGKIESLRIKNIYPSISLIHQYKYKRNFFNIINASFSLPFSGKEHFDKVFTNIFHALRKNGIFCGQLFGKKDQWNSKDSILIFMKKREVLNYFRDFQLLYLREVKKNFTNLEYPFPCGAKYAHYFEVIARKK